MTTRKNAGPSPRDLNLYALRVLAEAVERDALSPSQRAQLVGLLRRLGAGDKDPADVLGVRARRGERKSAQERKQDELRRMAMPLITTLMAHPDEGGQGISKDDAVALVASHFGLDEESVRRYWEGNSALRARTFPRPINSLP